MDNDLRIGDLMLLNFNNSRTVYSFESKDFNDYKKMFTKSDKTLKFSGYAIEHKSQIWGGEKTLYAIFIQDANIYFLAGSQCINVTGEEKFLIREKIGFFKYRLVLKSKREVFFSIDYYEFSKTEPEDMDSHFFVDALHWLTDSKTKNNLIKFWNSWNKSKSAITN